jgi:hypothetical protein
MEELKKELMKEINWCDGNLNNHIDELESIIVNIHKREATNDHFRNKGGTNDILEGEYGRNLKKALM